MYTHTKQSIGTERSSADTQQSARRNTASMTRLVWPFGPPDIENVDGLAARHFGLKWAFELVENCSLRCVGHAACSPAPRLIREIEYAANKRRGGENGNEAHHLFA